MIAAAAAAAAAPVFGAAAFGGSMLGRALVAGRMPYADGPAPASFRRRYVALAGAFAGAALALHGVAPLHLALLAAVVAALAGCSAADLTCGMLPDVLTVGPLALVAAVAALERDWMPPAGAAFAALPFAGAALVSRGRGMGWGDVKLAALGGALLGAAGAALAFTAAAFAAYAVTRMRGTAARPLAFGPYLAASIVAMLAVVRTN